MFNSFISVFRYILRIIVKYLKFRQDSKSEEEEKFRIFRNSSLIDISLNFVLRLSACCRAAGFIMIDLSLNATHVM